MRTGAYGSSSQRTYGVLGNEVNIAARLMSRARPGQLLISQQVAEAAARNYRFHSLGAVEVKGKEKPIPVFGLASPDAPTAADEAGIPAHLAQVLAASQAGRGQVLRIEIAARVTAQLVQRLAAASGRTQFSGGPDNLPGWRPNGPARAVAANYPGLV